MSKYKLCTPETAKLQLVCPSDIFRGGQLVSVVSVTLRYIPRGFDWIPMDSDGIPMGSAALQWHSIVFSGFHGIPTAFNVILMNPVSEYSCCPPLATTGGWGQIQK